MDSTEPLTIFWYDLDGMYNEFLRYFERMNELYNGMLKAWEGSISYMLNLLKM
ncbi:MAG: hypothetical protein WCF06_01495 [Nitrososphaeraceae archaeon]